MLLNILNSFLILLLYFLFIPSSSTNISMLQPSPQHHHNKHPHVWHKFKNLIHAKKGSQLEGIGELKRYFHSFGYYHHLYTKGTKNNNFSNNNMFDDHLEHVITRYQQIYHLPVTGTLNSRTLSLIMSPRCGMPDHYDYATTTNNKLPRLHGTRHYKYFQGQPRWSRSIPMTLTYAFSQDDMIHYLRLEDIRLSFERAFSKWASVIPIKFVETNDYTFADIRIGFYNGDHGDGEPFDGVLGVLAHAFSPESGRFHLDAAEIWAVDFDKERAKMAVDLESVALHEIGHVLGLSHSHVKDSVMFPSLKPREKKLNLKFDDIEGVQNLYGSNPNFTIGSLLESETSSSSSLIDLRERLSKLLVLFSFILFVNTF